MIRQTNKGCPSLRGPLPTHSVMNTPAPNTPPDLETGLPGDSSSTTQQNQSLPFQIRPFRDFLNGESEADCRARIAKRVATARSAVGTTTFPTW